VNLLSIFLHVLDGILILVTTAWLDANPLRCHSGRATGVYVGHCFRQFFRPAAVSTPMADVSPKFQSTAGELSCCARMAQMVFAHCHTFGQLPSWRHVMILCNITNASRRSGRLAKAMPL